MPETTELNRAKSTEPQAVAVTASRRLRTAGKKAVRAAAASECGAGGAAGETSRLSLVKRSRVDRGALSLRGEGDGELGSGRQQAGKANSTRSDQASDGRGLCRGSSSSCAMEREEVKNCEERKDKDRTTQDERQPCTQITPSSSCLPRRRAREADLDKSGRTARLLIKLVGDCPEHAIATSGRSPAQREHGARSRRQASQARGGGMRRGAPSLRSCTRAPTAAGATTTSRKNSRW